MQCLLLLLRATLVVTLAAMFGACSAESRKTRALERAGEAYRAGDLEKARIEYQNVVQAFPDDPTANERLALIWYERGAAVRALAYFGKLNLQSTSSQPLRLKRARLVLGLGRTAEARREAEAILRTSQNVPEALVLLTETVREREDFKLAEEAVQKFPDKTSVFYHLANANLLQLRGDAAGVRSALQRAVAADPKSAEARAAMARSHASQNNSTQALADFKAAAELAPARSTVRLAYAAYLAQTGAVADATALLKEMTQKTPDYLPAWRALAQLALQERRFDDAAGYLQSALRQDNSDVDTMVLHAKGLLARGDAKGAIAALTQVGTALPGLGVEKFTLALAHLQNRDDANALAALEQTVALFPDNADALLLFAQVSLRAGKPQPAAEAMSGLVRRRPDLTQAYLLLIEALAALDRLEPLAQSLVAGIPSAPNKAQLNYLLGIVYLRQAKTDDARRAFESALAISPDLLAAAMEVVNLDLRENKLDAALARAQAVATQFPRLAAGPVLVARIQLARKDWAAAQTAALAAAELAPGDAGVYAVAVPAFASALDQPAALGRLDAFLAKHIAQPLAVLFGGQIYTAKKDYAKVRDLYEKHLAANPGSAAVMNNLANLFVDQLNELDRGHELARKARELDPTSPAVADTLGWILYRKNDARGALPHLQFAAAGLADNPEVQYHLGVASLAAGDEANALATLRVAAAAKGEFAGKADAVAKLAELERKQPVKTK